MSSRKRIRNIEIKRAHILEKMITFDLMFPGAYKEINRKCGKKSCWCYEQGGHHLRRINWKEKGHGKTKSVPKEDVKWVKSVTDNYRSFRKNKKEIQKLEETLKELIDAYAAEIINKTRSMKGYL